MLYVCLMHYEDNENEWTTPSYIVSLWINLIIIALSKEYFKNTKFKVYKHTIISILSKDIKIKKHKNGKHKIRRVVILGRKMVSFRGEPKTYI